MAITATVAAIPATNMAPSSGSAERRPARSPSPNEMGWPVYDCDASCVRPPHITSRLPFPTSPG